MPSNKADGKQTTVNPLKTDLLLVIFTSFFQYPAQCLAQQSPGEYLMNETITNVSREREFSCKHTKELVPTKL